MRAPAAPLTWFPITAPTTSCSGAILSHHLTRAPRRRRSGAMLMTTCYWPRWGAGRPSRAGCYERGTRGGVRGCNAALSRAIRGAPHDRRYLCAWPPPFPCGLWAIWPALRAFVPRSSVRLHTEDTFPAGIAVVRAPARPRRAVRAAAALYVRPSNRVANRRALGWGGWARRSWQMVQ